jgi:hypothetical protein
MTNVGKEIAAEKGPVVTSVCNGGPTARLAGDDGGNTVVVWIIQWQRNFFHSIYDSISVLLMVVVCSFVSFALVFVMNSSGGWK